MSSFSAVVFVLFRFRLFAFTKVVALRSIVLRSSICLRPDSHTSFSLSLFLEMSLFPSIFCTITVFTLYGEYVVRFPLPDDVFLPRDHVLVF